jgi:hypothetical protein
MILFVFAVRDRATDQFGTPMFLVNSGQAIRSFADEINREAADNMLYRHPDDYDLYSMGSFDSSLGLFNTKVPEMVSIGKNVKL